MNNKNTSLDYFHSINNNLPAGGGDHPINNNPTTAGGYHSVNSNPSAGGGDHSVNDNQHRGNHHSAYGNQSGSGNFHPIKGLSERRCKNGFYVAQLHYTAEPGRDPATPEGRMWYENARRGMPEASWRKEYEIDWFARSGQLVYPLFRRDLHVVEPFAVPSDWSRYMAVDPGIRNPTAVLWCAVDPENILFFMMSIT